MIYVRSPVMTFMSPSGSYSFVDVGVNFTSLGLDWVTFAVQGCSDLHIALSSRTPIGPYQAGYEIVMGASGNRVSMIG